MCKSKAEGGQRCYAHTAADVKRAEKAATAAHTSGNPTQVAAAEAALRDARVDLATTKRGRTETVDRMNEHLTAGQDAAAADDAAILKDADRKAAAAAHDAEQHRRRAETPPPGEGQRVFHTASEFLMDAQPGDWYHQSADTGKDRHETRSFQFVQRVTLDDDHNGEQAGGLVEQVTFTHRPGYGYQAQVSRLGMHYSSGRQFLFRHGPAFHQQARPGEPATPATRREVFQPGRWSRTGMADARKNWVENWNTEHPNGRP